VFFNLNLSFFVLHDIADKTAGTQAYNGSFEKYAQFDSTTVGFSSRTMEKYLYGFFAACWVSRRFTISEK
jgi:hypothetical protein